MSGIVWLASYPKSGNTWFRAFLANLLHDGDEPLPINQIQTGGIASARVLFDEMVGIDAADLTPDEIDALRPAVYRRWAAEHVETGYHKIHDAYTLLPNGEPLVPTDATRGVLYFVRNPLDVAVSYSNHSGQDLDTVIEWMGDESHCLGAGPRQLHSQLRQRLLSWSGHVSSWIDQTEVPVHVVRYEDMLQSPTETFSTAAAFAGLATDPERVERAIRFSSFDELRRQEKADGFRERPGHVEAFFRRGKAGAWRQELTNADAERVIAEHSSLMARSRYLDEDGTRCF